MPCHVCKCCVWVKYLYVSHGITVVMYSDASSYRKFFLYIQQLFDFPIPATKTDSALRFKVRRKVKCCIIEHVLLLLVPYNITKLYDVNVPVQCMYGRDIFLMADYY